MTNATPKSSASRLGGVDAARGLAVLGMVAVHVLPRTTDEGGRSLPFLIASGRSAAAFAVLAGVGVALATRGSDRWRQRPRLLLRALLVGALGLSLGGLDSGVYVILAYYGVFFLLLLPFLGWPPRRLLLAAGIVSLLVPVLSYRVRPSLEGIGGDNPTWSSLGDPGPLLNDLLLTGVYPALPWLTYLLAGLAVGRLALGRTSTAVRLALVGAGLAIGARLVSALLIGPLGGGQRLAEVLLLPDPGRLDDVLGEGAFGNVPTDTPWWLAVDVRHGSTTLDLLGTTGTALLVLGLCLLVVPRARGLLTPLTAVGSMPLTLYSAHIVVLHLTDGDDDPTRYYLLQVGAALVIAPLWRRYVGRGPLEAGVAVASRTVGART